MSKHKQGIKLASDDLARMQRLHEEISGRIEEMAMIAARATASADEKFVGLAREKRPEVRFNSPHKGEQQMIPITWCYGSGPGMCICYGDGVCYVCDNYQED